MIDFHSHILPGIDDGSKNAEVSVKMLEIYSTENIDAVVLTPHYYINQSDISSFAEKRRSSLALLKNSLKPDIKYPKLILGAEVLFFNDLYTLENINQLCIENTDYILIEMPFVKWTQKTYDSLYYLMSNCSLKPVIAHVERYRGFQKNGSRYIDELIEAGCLLQMNASNFIHLKSRLSALHLLKKKKISIIGSDCHNLTSRLPNLHIAEQKISKLLGQHEIDRINSISEAILKNENINTF